MKQNTQIYKPNSNTLKLNTFKNLYKSLKTPWQPLNWIILGYLIGIENRYIDLKAKQTVDTAIETYMTEHPDTVYEAVVEECEDGNGYTIGYFPEKEDE